VEQIEQELRNRIEQVGGEITPAVGGDIAYLADAGVRSMHDLLARLRDRDSDTDLRRICIWAVGQLRAKSVARDLLAVFDETDPTMYWEAAKSLGFIRSKRVVKPLVDLLYRSTDANMRSAIIYALGLIGDKRALIPLLEVLRDVKGESSVRAHAAEALAFLRRSEAVSSLINSLKDESSEVRFWSAYALGEVGDVRALPELERVALSDHDSLPGWWSISKEATNAIEAIRAKTSRNP
jgi:HEAT repeat protein